MNIMGRKLVSICMIAISLAITTVPMLLLTADVASAQSRHKTGALRGCFGPDGKHHWTEWCHSHGFQD
jgi:hypothetical protein